MEMQGIDVSAWQGEIDWQKVKATGIQFAFIRAAAGQKQDARCEENLAGAKKAGVPFGLYLYSYADTAAEAEAEADFLLGIAKGTGVSWPLVFDQEDAAQKSLTKAQRTEMALAFAKKVKAAGYTPMFYSSKYWLENQVDAAAIQKEMEVWVAQWGASCTYKGKYAVWQYSNKGQVNGITGDVDRDCSCVDYGAAKPEGWRKVGAKWYYGDLKNCWKQIDGRWYWFEPDGMMATGIREIGGKWYALADRSIGPVKEGQCIYTDANGAILS